MGKEHIKEHQFKKGNKFGKGRPKKLVSSTIETLKAEGYEEVTSNHIKQAYQMLIGLDRDKIMEIGKDNDQSMLMRVVSRAILDNKGFEIIEKMLDRAHGKATNKTEVTGAEGEKIEFKIEVVQGDNINPIKPE